MWHGIRGHDAIVERFRESIRCCRLASTYLFVGPHGVGKRTFALALAKSLLCTETPDLELAACEACESCRLFASGTHPDLDVVGLPPGKRALPIEMFVGDRDHRNQEGLCHNIALRPRLGSRRVAVIDDADWLTVESANCLLKTLEEPPPGALIVLVGESRSRQLPTILSRAQIVRFTPLESELVAELLAREGIVADVARARELAEAAGGSLSRAALLADDAFWALRERLEIQLGGGWLDVPRLAADLTEAINQAGKEAAQRRQRFHQIVQLAVEVYRKRLVEATRIVSSGAHPDMFDGLLEALDRSVEAELQIDRNANQSTLLEGWLLDLAAAPQPTG